MILKNLFLFLRERSKTSVFLTSIILTYCLLVVVNISYDILAFSAALSLPEGLPYTSLIQFHCCHTQGFLHLAIKLNLAKAVFLETRPFLGILEAFPIFLDLFVWEEIYFVSEPLGGYSIVAVWGSNNLTGLGF